MQNENIIVKFLTKKYHEYSSKIKSFISHPTVDESNHISKTSLKPTFIKLILICLSISITYLFLSRSTTIVPPTNTNIIQIQKEINRTKPNAFIITASCNSLRYNATKENIEKAFPNFFNFICFLTISLNDSRIDTSEVLTWKKFSSNSLAFTKIWAYEISKQSKDNELEWSFIFEDDVNFMDPSLVSLPNFITPLQELMYNPEIQIKDGFFFLGICGPTFDNDSQPLISKNTKNTLISQKGYGSCLHATGITANRSRLFWTEISSYRPSSLNNALDFLFRQYCIRSKNHFYVFGTNFKYPPDTGHYGIAFQDRDRFGSTID